MLLWDSWKILYTRNAWNDIHKSMTMQKILHNYVFVRRTLIGSGMKPDNPPSNSLYMSANRAHNQPRRDSVYFCHIYWRSECRRYRSSISSSIYEYCRCPLHEIVDKLDVPTSCTLLGTWGWSEWKILGLEEEYFVVLCCIVLCVVVWCLLRILWIMRNGKKFERK